MFGYLRGEVLEIRFNVFWGEHQESVNYIFGDCHCESVLEWRVSCFMATRWRTH